MAVMAAPYGTMAAPYGTMAGVAKTVDLIKAKGGKVTREPGPVKGGKTVIAFIEDPDGYKFELLERGPTPEPLCQVMLRVGDLDRSIEFYEKAFGMELLRKRDNPDYKYTIAMLGYGPEDKSAVIELTYNYGVTEYDKGNAYAQIAIGTDDVYQTAEAVKLCGGKITREPGPLPGINTKITACLDPDGWKTKGRIAGVEFGLGHSNMPLNKRSFSSPVTGRRVLDEEDDALMCEDVPMADEHVIDMSSDVGVECPNSSSRAARCCKDDGSNAVSSSQVKESLGVLNMMSTTLASLVFEGIASTKQVLHYHSSPSVAARHAHHPLDHPNILGPGNLLMTNDSCTPSAPIACIIRPSLRRTSHHRVNPSATFTHHAIIRATALQPSPITCTPHHDTAASFQ
ncbi:probable lactoylglutathione lyase chloroplast [Phtheirospermum japonicum]|uniref:lactoylglutathione lyase n=1 Tax=Phtheirospermum japonicum TaxID=374723 RepID=A0A830D2B8_9LAMI|nr:probable lactoylglutathione lyase chloroplast [Phtheirospermum japonicum]